MRFEESSLCRSDSDLAAKRRAKRFYSKRRSCSRGDGQPAEFIVSWIKQSRAAGSDMGIVVQCLQSVMRSAVTLLTRVRSPLSRPWPKGGLSVWDHLLRTSYMHKY
ncbi:hypothetical protein PoB_005608600 [Plakobranchus ocellatus]|uniref:Uncharacterized protein n=1 Tax=Plakobranchus ocellatus TaxID=259542 RepID=A0AAV4CE17_9GAST|nr:hypothetical protein PoB_005608600 [Plakobranchus ocellatus]